MTDPTRYIRKAVIDGLQTGDFYLYGQNPPGSAATPYGVVSVTVEQRPVKGVKIWTANIDIDIYHEFREYGGRKVIDELTDSIITIMVPDDSAYLDIDNFNHANCKLVSTSERATMDNSITSYQKTIRFQSIVNE